MTPKKVLITPATLANREGAYLQVLRESGFEILFPRVARQLLEDELLVELKGVTATIAGSEPYTRRVLQAHPQLRVIARAGVGFDAVDVATATELGIAVCTTPGTNEGAVAEHTFCLMLALAKRLIPQHLGTKAGKWPRDANIPLRGRTLGIAGLGRIGKAVAVRGAAFGMKLLAYEKFPDHSFARQHGVTFVGWEQLLRESDYLTLHVPATPESQYMINRKSLALMKPTAFLINTARGAIVNEADLLEALQKKQIAGAGLDVFEQEPPTPGPLFELDNVVLTPHAAGVDLKSRDDMALAAARAVAALAQGKWPAEQVVNPEVRERFRW